MKGRLYKDGFKTVFVLTNGNGCPTINIKGNDNKIRDDFGGKIVFPKVLSKVISKL